MYSSCTFNAYITFKDDGHEDEENEYPIEITAGAFIYYNVGQYFIDDIICECIYSETLNRQILWKEVSTLDKKHLKELIKEKLIEQEQTESDYEI